MKFEEAREKYDQALSIVSFVSGVTESDQKEIDLNRAACLMNIGAVCMQMKYFGEAVCMCLFVNSKSTASQAQILFYIE